MLWPYRKYMRGGEWRQAYASDAPPRRQLFAMRPAKTAKTDKLSWNISRTKRYRFGECWSWSMSDSDFAWKADSSAGNKQLNGSQPHFL